MSRSLAVGLALTLAGLLPAGAGEAPAADTWRSFAGTWSAMGRRQTLAVEGGGAAAIFEISGAIVLTNGEGLSRGFSGHVIGFDDGQGVTVGRCVWTDESGARLFSRLKGESPRTGRRFLGTITGGTGRYAGLEGEYAFTWQYSVVGEDGAFQGRVADLSGRVRQGGGASR